MELRLSCTKPSNGEWMDQSSIIERMNDWMTEWTTILDEGRSKVLMKTHNEVLHNQIIATHVYWRPRAIKMPTFWPLATLKVVMTTTSLCIRETSLQLLVFSVTESDQSKFTDISMPYFLSTVYHVYRAVILSITQFFSVRLSYHRF